MKSFSKKNYVAISIDEGSTKKRKNLDFVLECAHDAHLKSYPADVQTMSNLTAKEYAVAIGNGLIAIARYKINISVIICDGCLAQKKALSETWKYSVLRTAKEEFMKKLIFIPCLCHRIQNAFSNAISKNEELNEISDHIHHLSEIFIEKESEIGSKCPQHISTRWIYDYDICNFIKKHYEKCKIITPIRDELSQFHSIATIFKALSLIFEDPKTPLSSAYPILQKAAYVLEELSETIPIAKDFWRSFIHYTIQSSDRPLWHLAYIFSLKGHEEYLKILQNPYQTIQKKGFIKDFYVGSKITEVSEKEIDEEIIDQYIENLIDSGEAEFIPPPNDINKYIPDIENDNDEYDSDEVSRPLTEEELADTTNDRPLTQIIKTLKIYLIRIGCPEDELQQSIDFFRKYIVTPINDMGISAFDDRRLNWLSFRNESKTGQWVADLACRFEPSTCGEASCERTISIQRLIMGSRSLRSQPRLLNARLTLKSIINN